MYIISSFVILVISIGVLAGLRLSKYSNSYSWLTAVLGTLFTWVSLLLWQLNLPRGFSPSIWIPVKLFSTSPHLMADTSSWLYSISLAAISAAVILTSPARTKNSLSPTSWAGTLALTILALLAVLADNPLTLVLCWTAIDLTEFYNTLRVSDSAALSERSVISFSVRAAGTGIALWASVLNSMNGQVFSFEQASSQTTIILMIAVGLRLGVLPLHLAYRTEPALRRGFGTIMRLSTAASSLILLARLPANAIESQSKLVPWMLLLVAMAAVYGGWNWFFAKNEISGRPFWIIGMSALSMAATLRGSSTASAAWGSSMILFGGIAFLYSARKPIFSRIISVLAVFLLALPYTITSTGWNGTFPYPYFFLPFFMTTQMLLAAGFIRHIFLPAETNFDELPAWAQTSAPIGIGIIGITIILSGFWGWPGALQVGSWKIISAMLFFSCVIILSGRRLLQNIPADLKSRLTTLQLPDLQIFSKLASGFWFIFHFFRRLISSVNDLLEGDGGLLWTLLLLVLFITIFQGSK